jgi:hypothetical protein
VPRLLQGRNRGLWLPRSVSSLLWDLQLALHPHPPAEGGELREGLQSPPDLAWGLGRGGAGLRAGRPPRYGQWERLLTCPCATWEAGMPEANSARTGSNKALLCSPCAHCRGVESSSEQ